MKILCAFGQHNYGDPSRGEGYEYWNFIPALKSLGHEVVFFETWDRTRYRNFAELNRNFLTTVEAEQPDVVFCVLMHYELWTETLDMLREQSNAVTINWGTDDSWKYRQFSRFLARHVDVYATTSQHALLAARRDGYDNFVATQWAAGAAALAEPLAARQCGQRVTFVGTAYGARARWIAALQERGIEVECYGHGWPRGPVAASAISGIIRNSIITLNFSDAGQSGGSSDDKSQIKARVFEVTAAGGFLLTQGASGLENYFVPGEEIAVFTNVDELEAAIRFFLDHPDARDRVAVAGHRRTRDCHTYELRFSALLAWALERRDRDVKKRGATACRFNWAQVSQIESRHRAGGVLRMAGKALVSICALIWGSRRGPRAARRLVFELSWRLAGEKTFSAVGIPGRLFYSES